MPFVNITGLWSKNGKAPGVRMTPELRQKFIDIPDGTYINLYPNTRKQADNHPDWNLTISTPNGQYQGNRNTLGPDVNSHAATNYYAGDDIPF